MTQVTLLRGSEEGAFFEELSAALAAIPSNHFSNLTINEAIVGEKGGIEG